tara:strand:+ start:4435 stop:4683 length:249 start_codon:yes stop_codon:yes gene_type:complete
MYPEGYLIDPKGKLLFHFHKEEISQKRRATGFIDKWDAVERTPKKLKNRKNASAHQAISEWIKLTENGWRCIEIDLEVKKAA